MTAQSKRFQQLQFQQVDAALSTWRGARTVRETLGIPATAQAKQLAACRTIKSDKNLHFASNSAALKLYCT